MLLFHALTMSAAHLLLCFVAGLGLALFLPTTLRTVQLLLAPAIGLALLAILGFYGTVAGLTLRQILPLALLLALVLLGLRLHSRSWLASLPPLELTGLSLIILCTWGLSVAPVLAKGALMPLGYGMDVEFYMGLAAYLKDYSYVNLIHAPSSPMQALISNPIQPFERPDGRYFVALWIYQGEDVRRQIPIARFEQQDGQIRNVETLDYNAVFIPLARAATPVGATIGESIGLNSYSLSSTSLRPGANLDVGVLWEALGDLTNNPLVFVQLLGPNAEKVAQWDGHVGGDWYPSEAWHPGMQIWQDIPLRISAEARPGTYQLVVGVYDLATGARWGGAAAGI